MAMVELSVLAASKDAETGGFWGKLGFAGTGLSATADLQRILIQAAGVYAATSEHARMVFTCAKFGGGSGQSNDVEASKVYASQLFLGSFFVNAVENLSPEAHSWARSPFLPGF